MINLHRGNGGSGAYSRRKKRPDSVRGLTPLGGSRYSPGAALRAGNGVAAQAAWMSARDLPAGSVGDGSVTAAGVGMTSEQSMSVFGLWPTTASFIIACSNLVTMLV